MSATWFIWACATLLFILINPLTTVTGQRSPFAGSRPPNGLSQKDKYTMNSLQRNSISPAISSRFGAPENNVPFGIAERPPVGLPIVRPLQSFVPIQTAAGAGTRSQTVSFANRIGETSAQQQQLSPLPIDARGDRRLINQLLNVPIDNRPFWLLNYKAIEAHRNSRRPFSPAIVQTRGSFAG